MLNSPDIKSLFLKSSILITVAIYISICPVKGQMAEGECNFVGNIISSSIPADFNTYWNQVTPENSGKWGSAEPTRDNMNWSDLDKAYNHALENGYPFKQHTFIWENQKPTWIDDLTHEEQREEVEEWIRLYGERYPETDFIDVVNEPLHASPTYRFALGGSGETGYDWVVWSFEKAREHNPNAQLLLNDYNILNSIPATRKYIEIIEILQERDLIDGIGVQGHFLEGTTNNTINENLNSLAATGLPVYITEYDINLVNDDEQLEVIREQFPLLYSHHAVKGITFWGYQESHIWREDAFLVRSNGTERPALEWLKGYITQRCSGVLGLYMKANEINIFPNPASNGIITLNSSQIIREIFIFDMTGEMVRHQKFGRASSVELTLMLPPGVYILKANGADHVFTERILIN